MNDEQKSLSANKTVNSKKIQTGSCFFFYHYLPEFLSTLQALNIHCWYDLIGLRVVGGGKQ